MKQLLLTLLVFVGISSQSNAISLQFKLDIFSSGTDLYACNAGLKHSLHGDRVCFERDTLKSCNPSSCTEGEACNCVCTGGNDSSRAGEYRLDFMKAKYADWAEKTDGIQNATPINKPAGYSDFNKLFDQDQDIQNHTTSYRKQLTHLEFNLGSERYGSEYFLDICYRASQIKYPNDVTLYYLIKRYVTITDLGHTGSHTDDFNGSNGPIFSEDYYQDLAGLEIRSRLLCKDKENQIVLNLTTPWADFSTGQLKSFPNQGTRSDLKKCIVRYSFREANRTGLESIRKWKLQHARVCTYTSVNEDDVL